MLATVPGRLLRRLLGAILALGAASSSRADDGALFRQSIAPILEQHCVRCHQGATPKGGLSLTDGPAFMRGGDSDAPIVPGSPDESLLIDYISGDKPEMPKGAPPLGVAEVDAIRRWVAAGAVWPDGPALTEKTSIDTDWWSLRPIVRPQVPQQDSSWVRTEIDSFTLAGMRAHNLQPAPEANHRTLIRRLYFDLIGLPPDPDEVDAFVADPDPQAYEKLVDRLLESPRYGERWARHWLDVVHYGETHGYDKDQPRPNAWPYRDYVIRALNSDKPYSRFVEEQIAGDVLYPGTTDGIEALGFIAAGPWDLIGHMEVPEAKIDGQIARHLDRDDMVGTTMNTFVSLTVQCAQCHDHKFDPISQADYYGLQAVFAALDRADKAYDSDPAIGPQRSLLTERRRELEAKQRAIDAKVRDRAGTELADLDAQIEAQSQPRGAVQALEFGYHSALDNNPNATKWVQVDLGSRVELQSIVYTPCYDEFNNIGAGFGFPLRFKIEVCDEPAFASGVQTIVDQTQADFPNPGLQLQELKPPGIAGRYVRMTATKLAPRQNDFMFALAELAVFDGGGSNVALHKPVMALDSIEAAPRWSARNLVDNLAPAASGDPDAAKTTDELSARRTALLDRVVDKTTRHEQEDVASALAATDAALAELPPVQLVYAGTVHQGSGSFVGTGASGGKPRQIRVLSRGDVRSPGAEAHPGALRQIEALPGDFALSAEHSEGEARAALARWLTDKRNPLTWRSIVNRVWLYHFGRGLVDTPNDFGRMGQAPSNPELLDWLAVEFRDSGQSLKRLHRLIVTSATYRQSSLASPDAVASDSQNVWLSHMTRRRLEAEAIRDSVLLVSGKLDLTMYGPSFQDFVIEKPEHSPHYKYNLADPDDSKSHRRSIYRFVVRSQQQPLLAALDCADPSVMVDKRNQTITPLAALAMLNNQLPVAMAKHLAARVAEPGADLRMQVQEAFRLAIGRAPTDVELSDLVKYAEEFGLLNTCRVILNLNEFVFID